MYGVGPVEINYVNPADDPPDEGYIEIRRVSSFGMEGDRSRGRWSFRAMAGLASVWTERVYDRLSRSFERRRV